MYSINLEEGRVFVTDVFQSIEFWTVLQAQGSAPGERSLWVTTWQRIDKFLPSLKTELFPPKIYQPQIEEKLDTGKFRYILL